MIYPIYVYGQPVLRKVAEDIDSSYPDLEKLIADMFDTMYRADGVGLAAPQIGLPIRLVTIGLDVVKDTYPEYEGFKRAYINARVVETAGEEVSMEEGCLSLPGVHESVKRASRIRVVYCDEHFVEHDEWVDGFLARVMQHEFDHLEGHVFVDRVSPLRRQMLKSKLSTLAKGKVSCSYKIKK